jgi:hypothetical protein
MFNKRIKNMEKHLDTFSKLLPFLRKKFEECKDTFTTVMIDLDKHRVQLIYSGEKVIHLDG